MDFRKRVSSPAEADSWARKCALLCTVLLFVVYFAIFLSHTKGAEEAGDLLASSVSNFELKNALSRFLLIDGVFLIHAF